MSQASAAGPVEPTSSLFAAYRPPPNVYDQMFDAGGALRPAWHAFVSSLDDLGAVELAGRWEYARRLIRENGVTYNVHGDQGGDRPWMLDPIPLLLSQADFAEIDVAMQQRARLLNLVLADVYGPQDLLTEGVLPAEIVYSGGGFLRACHGVTPPGGVWLHLYFADIARRADGSLMVLSDRTQTPSGAGYALENRLVLSRIIPEAFRISRVQRLASFFRAAQQSLYELAQRHRDNPRVIVLSPGPLNQNYFEHAYLARYLGYGLAEGGDLTCRDGHVYLKTLGGLQQVDVILRRLDDAYCDPLELRPDSFLGVPGLVNAVRQRNVVVANALGSGLVESPALMPFLPALCRRLLAQDLLVPSVDTWWCGHADARNYVLDQLPQMVVRLVTRSWEPIFPARLAAAELDELRQRINARPELYVGQAQPSLATAPALVDGTLQPRATSVRVILAATAEGYHVMPGGLARFSGDGEVLNFSMSRGGGSKDVWVVASGPVDQFSMLPPPESPVPLSRGGGDLPSRVADNLFWLGRYVERAEGIVRLARGVLSRLSDQPLQASDELLALVSALAQQTGGLADEMQRDPFELLAAAIVPALFDRQRDGSLVSCIDASTRVARIVRDRISLDTWRVLSSLAAEMEQALAGARRAGDLLIFLNRLIRDLSAFGGLAFDSMTRGHGWRFLDMGRRMERAFNVLGLMQYTLIPVRVHDDPLLEAVLEIAESWMTYRRRYLTSLQVAPLVDLLLVDETNPRSVAFQVAQLADNVDHLPRDQAHPRRSREQKVAARLLTTIRVLDVEDIVAVQEDSRHTELERTLGRCRDEIAELSEAISLSYLSHTVLSRQLSSLRGGE